MAAELADRWQRTSFDYLVNNAGFGQMSMFADTTEELYDRFHRVILKGPFFLTQALLPLLADGGAIVNTTSNSALPTGVEPGYSAYASMKGGLTVLTRYLAKELSARGIRVNSVAPGPTRTGMISDDVAEHFPDVIASLVDRTALGRLGDGDDIGKVIAALLSDDCGGSPARTSRSPAASTCSDRHVRNLCVLEVLVDEGDAHAALANRRSHALDRGESHVTAAEDPGNARFEEVRIAGGGPAAGRTHLRDRRVRSPARSARSWVAGAWSGVRADEDVQTAGGYSRIVSLLTRFRTSISSSDTSPWAAITSLSTSARMFACASSWATR